VHVEGYVPAQLDADAFHCPQCGTYGYRLWYELFSFPHISGAMSGWRGSSCGRCHEWVLWREDEMVYPPDGRAPLPNPDMPADIQRDYEEARAILSRSPRGAAALLRLAIQKLCRHLGEPGKNIDQDIAALVRKGLNERVQKALDTVRVIGNEAVHPGTIDLRDDPALAGTLFKLVNLIVEKMITEPREIDDLYTGLPAAKRDAIAKRDGKV
jgi:hypothetical protein